MIFRPELAKKVMAGEKTQTRRLVSDNPRSPWGPRCGFGVGESYAVQPGRGKHAIGRIEILDVRQETLADVGDSAAEREGFATFHEFVDTWRSLHGEWDHEARVWVLTFRVAS